jgi:hypothetical protein
MRWSFSQWSMYNKCPAQFGYRYRQRLPWPQSAAAARGVDKHATVELYIKCEKHEPPMGDYLRQTLDSYRHHPNGERYVEYKLGFDRDWNHVWRNGEQSWCVMVLDAARVEEPENNQQVVHIAEWKTGKAYDEHKEQRSIYSLGGLRKWPLAVEVQTTTYYLDETAAPARLTVKRSAEEKLMQLWSGRADQMQNDTTLSPRPGVYCRWCPYSKFKGGPCRVG